METEFFSVLDETARNPGADMKDVSNNRSEPVEIRAENERVLERPDDQPMLNNNNDKKTKPRFVDQFFKQQTFGAVLSPIKVGPLLSVPNETQESLELKLDSTCSGSNRRAPDACIQPDYSYMGSMNALVAQSELTTDGSMGDKLADKNSLNRKRSQAEMEPTVFGDFRLPIKTAHREMPPLIKFGHEMKLEFSKENTFPPDMRVENEPVEKNEPASKKLSSENEAGCLLEKAEKDNVSPDVCAEEPHEGFSSRTFNATIDMTFRTVGDWPILTAILLALDEALDPLVGSYVPEFMRRRGMNIVVVLIPVFIYVLYSLISAMS